MVLPQYSFIFWWWFSTTSDWMVDSHKREMECGSSK